MTGHGGPANACTDASPAGGSLTRRPLSWARSQATRSR